MKIQANLKKLGSRKPTNRMFFKQGKVYDVYVSGNKIIQYWYWNEETNGYANTGVRFNDEWITENGKEIIRGKAPAENRGK